MCEEVAMGEHSVERGEEAPSGASNAEPEVGPFEDTGLTGATSADCILFGDPSLDLFGGAR
jgi:hypothetical protein